MFYSWEGEGDTEVGKDKNTGKVIVRVNPKFYRPTEVVSLAILIWHPHRYFSHWYLYYIRHFLQIFLTNNTVILQGNYLSLVLCWLPRTNPNFACVTVNAVSMLVSMHVIFRCCVALKSPMFQSLQCLCLSCYGWE